MDAESRALARLLLGALLCVVGVGLLIAFLVVGESVGAALVRVSLLLVPGAALSFDGYRRWKLLDRD